MCEGQSPLVIVSVTSVGSYCVALGCQNKAILLDFTGLPRMNPGEKDGWQQSRGKAGKPLNTAGYVELILYG